MIVIDKMVFNFGMTDVQFAQGLYAGWDDFCHTCVTEVLDKYLSALDKQDVYIELDCLNLDLGGIPQESFYTDFPIRLREELEKCFKYATQSAMPTSIFTEKRLANLLHYLAYGFCLPGWGDVFFDLYEELLFFKEKDAEREITMLCFKQGYCMERLVRQLDKKQLSTVFSVWFTSSEEQSGTKRNLMAHLAIRYPRVLALLLESLKANKILIHSMIKLLDQGLEADNAITENALLHLRMRLAEQIPIALLHRSSEEWSFILSWLSSPSLSRYEKLRYLSILLDNMPQTVIRFIHETRDESSLNNLADLLENDSVKQIIVAESENHAEVDIPEYWHHLYEWLLEYYPFNGVAIFGDKRHFQKHLNKKFLSFIRKRAYSAYLSKAELTLQFLLEVFGYAYYRDILKILYECQTRNEDGTPAYSGYFNMELYHILLRLSLLKTPDQENVNGEEAIMDLTENINKQQKLLIIEEPTLLLKWLCLMVKKRQETVSWIANQMNESSIYSLTASISLHTAEWFAQFAEYIYANVSNIEWLERIGREELSQSIHRSMLHWCALNAKSASFDPQETLDQLIQLFCHEIKGKSTNTDTLESVRTQILHVFHLSVTKSISTHEDYAQNRATYFAAFSMEEHVEYMKVRFRDQACSVMEKRRLFALCCELHIKKLSELIEALHANSLLKHCISFSHPVIQKQLMNHLILQASGSQSVAYLLPFYGWIWAHETLLSPLLIGGKTDLKECIILLLARWGICTDKIYRNTTEITALFLTELFGNEQLPKLLKIIYRQLIPEFSSESADGYVHETESVLNLLLMVMSSSISKTALKEKLKSLDYSFVNRHKSEFDASQQHIKDDNDTFQIAFEMYLSSPDKFIGWIKNSTFSKESKRDILQQVIAKYPQKWIMLLQQGTSDREIVTAMVDIVPLSVLLHCIQQVHPYYSEVLNRIMNLLEQRSLNTSILHNSGMDISTVLQKALLYMLQDGFVFGNKILSPKEFLHTFLFYVFQASTGHTALENAEAIQVAQWKELERTVSEMLQLETDSATAGVVVNQQDEFALLASLSNPETLNSIKENILHKYLFWNPKILLIFIQQSILLGDITIDQWKDWLNIKDWMRLIAGVSLFKAELLQQVMDYLATNQGVDQQLLQDTFVQFLTKQPLDKWACLSETELIQLFIQKISFEHNKSEMDTPTPTNPIQNTILQEINIALGIKETEEQLIDQEAQIMPAYLQISNAGLALLTPWFPQLFTMLGYLNENKKDFNNNASRIRAVFMLQYLVFFEESSYKEQDLAFNRILVNLPFSVPLPKSLELTEQELKIAKGMLSGVKANWEKMQNTSIKGFLHSFIEREGSLDQQGEKCVLTVSERSYDLLLDSLPWGYKLIRFPWLKKWIKVVWREKEEFDY